MAKQARKLERAQARQYSGSEGKAKKKALAEPILAQPKGPEDIAAAANFKSLFLRLGLPVLAVWVLCGLIAGFSTSQTAIIVLLSIPSVLTVAAVGLVLWALRQANKAKGVAGILQGADSAEGRKAAIEQLDAEFKKKDPQAVFAKAQLLMAEDPDQALEVLETIDLKKVMAPVADQARAQRAMIYLMKGQAPKARDLVDAIELNRHQEAKTRAMMGSVVAEAWARTGQAKKAIETIELFNPEDEEYEELRPQLWRARAFAYAYGSKQKDMRKALRKLMDLDVRLLGGFMMGKVHPLLQKEAKKMVERSGQVPRKMIVQRRM